MQLLRTLGWLACVVYSTIPLFWLMVHPRAHRWRAREGSPFLVLVPAWIVMWVGVGALTGPWRLAAFYSIPWTWVPAALLFAAGILLYSTAGAHFSWAQLGGLPEVRAGHQGDRLVTTGIRSRVRHPVYLGHLCEMLAWKMPSWRSASAQNMSLIVRESTPCCRGCAYDSTVANQAYRYNPTWLKADS